MFAKSALIFFDMDLTAPAALVLRLMFPRISRRVFAQSSSSFSLFSGMLWSNLHQMRNN